MENVTHTLAGAAMGQAFFRRRLGPEAVTTLMLASNLPDVDVAVLLSRDPLAVTSRRTFGHSLMTVPLLAALLAWVLGRRYQQRSFSALWGLCLLGAGVHLFFDLINSFGVVLLWPLSPWRPELAWTFIIDPMLTGLLAWPFLLALGRRGDLGRRCALACALAFAYLGFCGLSRWKAERILARQRGSADADFAYVFPEPLGPQRFRGVLRHGGDYEVYLIRPWVSQAELRGYARSEPESVLVQKARATERGRRLDWFFKAPVWQETAGDAVRAFDLRFRPLVWPRGRAFEFTFRFGNVG